MAEAKDLIIGGAKGYNYNQLKPWVESIDEVGFEGDKVLVVGDMSDETMKQLEDKGWTLIPMQETGAPIHVARFVHIYEFLKDRYKDYRFVITTDVKDVYFQTNPIDTSQSPIL